MVNNETLYDDVSMEDIENEFITPVAKKSGDYDPKNYLNIRLADDENEKELRIRLLYVSNTSHSFFERIKMHNVKVPKEIAPSGWKNYVCLEKTVGTFNDSLGKKCPFCELNRDAYKKSTEAINDVDKKRWQEISIANIPGDVGIIRCIERGHENEGPKFWKFNIRQDKKDPMNQIMSTYYLRKKESIETILEENDIMLDKEKLNEICSITNSALIIENLRKYGCKVSDDFVPENIFSFSKGKDLKVTITRVMDRDGNPTDKTSVTVTDYGKNKPLAGDKETFDNWMNDTKVWSDVFVAKSYDYLSVILDGKRPWFDNEAKKWISYDEAMARKNGNKQSAENKVRDAEKKATQVTQVTMPENISSNEELPF